MNKLKEILMRVGVMVGSLLGRVLPMKQNVDKLSEKEIVPSKKSPSRPRKRKAKSSNKSSG